MRILILLILFTFIVCNAQVSEKHLLDKTRIVYRSLLNDTTKQKIVCRLHFINWDKPVYWSQTLLQSQDTLISFLRSFDWHDFEDNGDSSKVVNRDSVLYHIRSWFIKYMRFPKRYIISANDDRRTSFKQFSRSCFGESFRPLGYSDKVIDKIDSLFWVRHFKKPINCILPPIEPIRGGDEALYVYDSFTRKIVEFYRP
jgi:hypothetical protein